MYQQINDYTILRLADNAFISSDPNNQDYRAYLNWLKEGNEPLSAPVSLISAERTIEEKLSSIGLSVDDLKSALGLS